MNVIIMAAGCGHRLGKIGKHIPKCMLPLKNETILSKAINCFWNRGINDISIVIGYKAEFLRKNIPDYIKIYENKEYFCTNSIYSLWKAKHELKADTILLNGDVFFNPLIIDNLLNRKEDLVVVTDSTRRVNADYRIGYSNNHIKCYGKELSLSQTDAEYVGITKISENFIDKFQARLQSFINSGKLSLWWEEVLFSFIPDGVPVYFLDVCGKYWQEVDKQSDYARLLQHFNQNIEKPTLLVKSIP
jgi:L-glutamine-phosphate cytidylyltransferase